MNDEENQHVERLAKIREDLTAERQAVAMAYPSSPFPATKVEQLAALQLQIEIVDRAIADETKLKRSSGSSYSFVNV